MKHVSILNAGVAVAALGLALGATPAFAQDVPATAPATTPAPDALSDTIVVTGSRINRVDLKSASPIATIDAEQFRVTNTVTAESILSSSPQFVPGITSTTNNGNAGTATVDLRGLGDQRTLVLIDGKRMVPSDIGGAVDINAIPTILIKRVDVLTGGASSVYGADAISGVVNFVLDDKFTGFTLDGSSSISRYGDAFEGNISGAAGVKFADDRGHFVVAGQYTKRDGVYQSARAYSNQNLDANLKPSGSSNANPTVIDINSGRYQLNNGTQPGGPNNFIPANAQGIVYDPYNFNPANYLQVPLERYNITALGSFEFSKELELYARGSYTRSDVTAILAPTATAGFNFTISPTNPFLNPGQQALIFGDPGNLNADGTANVGIRRRITEGGGRVEKFKNQVYFGIVGARGDIGTTWHYDVSAQYGVQKRHSDFLNDLDYNKTTQAINAVAGPGGVAQCADPSGGCVPLNVFSNTPLSAASLAFIEANGSQDNHYTQFVTSGSIGGDVGFLTSPLATKAPAVSVGAEYRSETGSQLVDANYGSGNLIYYGQGTSVPEASFNVKEAFGELKLPLVTDKPLFQSLGLEAGGRYSAYTNNTTDGTRKNNQFTWKIGGDWAPVSDIRFRVLFNRAIRDPNIKELNSPVTQAGTDVLQTDPCSQGRPRGNAALAATCIAQGAPANLVNTGTIQDVIANQTNINAGGNTQLNPEKANTFTAGIVLSPSFIPGLHITADYYKIKIKGYIVADGAQDISNQCFNNNLSAYCALIVRNNINGQLTGSANANGQFPGVSEVLVNLGTAEVQGLDVTADYRKRFANGNSLTLAAGGTYVGQYYFNPGGGATAFNCAGKFGNTCAAVVGNPVPRWKHTVTAIYDAGQFTLSAKWRLIGSVNEDVGTDELVSHIQAYSYFDATVGFVVNKQFNFRVGMTNIFNIQPPVVGGSAGSSGTNSGNTFPNVYDALGRTYFAGFTMKL
ncbi:TonB-dependent receptor plug domain-containing protein [Novosphingobium sp.]|uniref:TonB-dependent receptor plug domain-containing protein n=1 Tax=Novosphingobium sp. TaxID=1874826 RepID=UPI003D0F9274